MIKRLVNNAMLRAGDATPVEWDFRADGVNPTTFMNFIATLSATDLADATLTMHMELQGLRPDPNNPTVNVWGLETNGDWSGGHKDRNNRAIVPYLDYRPGNEGFPLLLRGICTVNKDTRATVDVEIQ